MPNSTPKKSDAAADANRKTDGAKDQPKTAGAKPSDAGRMPSKAGAKSDSRKKSR